MNSFWADDALACGSMPSSDRRREVVDPQRSGTGAEEQIVEQPFVLEDQRAEFVWQGEDDVEVRHGQQFSRTGGQPLGARVPLALGTVPIAARVERDGLMAAASALIEMTAQCRGAAANDGIEHLAMHPDEASC